MKKVFHLLVVVFIFTSCETFHYFPMSQSTLEYKGKGDISASGYLGLAMDDVVAANMGYAFHDNLAVQYKYSFLDDNKLNELEFLVFKEFDENCFFGINSSFGLGRREKTYYNNNNLTFNHASVIPYFAYSNKYFDFALSFRISRLKHRLIFDEEQVSSYKWQNDFLMYSEEAQYDIGTRPFYFLTPALTFGVGYKYFKIKAQYVLPASKLNDASLNNYPDPALHIGISLRLNVLDK